MSFSLYDATLPAWRQTLRAVMGYLDKAQAHCDAQGVAPATLIEARLIDDMFPLGFQINSVCVHSLGAIEGVRRGTFSPDRSPWPADFAGLRAKVQATLEAIERLQPDEVNGLMGRDVTFQRGEVAVPFVAENFLLSFSLPNFYFHAATGYDILRSRGVPLGKVDYLGAVRKKA